MQPSATKSTKLVRKSYLNVTSSLKFPPLQLSMAEQLSNKESYIFSSKSTFLENASSVSTRSSNRLNDKNTVNSIVFSLQDSIRS